MSIRDFTEEQIVEMSAIELAFVLLNEEKKPYDYQQLFNRIVDLKGLNHEETSRRRTKLFTAFNLDGRFIHLGENHWGLREWYSLDQSDEELSDTVKPKKPADDDFDLEEETESDDDLEDIKDDLDDYSEKEDADEDEDNLDGFGNVKKPKVPDEIEE